MPEVFVQIARCESDLLHYKNGEVVRGNENPADVGVFQINTDYWEEEAKRLGIDIFTPEGNIEMAKHIFHNQGVTAWMPSHTCWGT